MGVRIHFILLNERFQELQLQIIRQDVKRMDKMRMISRFWFSGMMNSAFTSNRIENKRVMDPSSSRKHFKRLRVRNINKILLPLENCFSIKNSVKKR